MKKIKSKKAKATIVSISVAILLALLKTIFGVISGSLAVIASAVDSILDIISSSINYYAIKKAEAPPDENHPFGHGKFESLAAFIQSIIIMISGGFILYKSYLKIIHNSSVSNLSQGIYIMLFSIIITLFLVIYLNKTAKTENSNVLKADALHYEIDLFTNIGVLASLIIIKYTNFHYIDPLVSVIISLYIIFEAVKLAVEVSKDLLDAEIDSETKQQIIDILNDFDEFHLDFHNFRTRKAGSKMFVDFHLTLCQNLPLRDAHKICEKIENSIKNKIKDVDVIIHIDPCTILPCEGIDTCNRNKIILKLKELKNGGLNE
jgi:cation diffusion facilitator family transporter